MVLPIEVIYYINDYLPSDNLKVLIFVNKDFNKIYKNKMEENIIKIQNFYKKNRISRSYGADLPYFLGWEKYLRFVLLLSRKKYYRKVLLWNTLEYLKRLPEKILVRISLYSSRYLIIKNWIENNLDEVDLRKKSDISYFLNYNRIKVNELLDVGI